MFTKNRLKVYGGPANNIHTHTYLGTLQSRALLYIPSLAVNIVGNSFDEPFIAWSTSTSFLCTQTRRLEGGQPYMMYQEVQ